MTEAQIRPPNKSLQATAAMRCRFTSDWSHTAVVEGANAMPVAVPQLGRWAASPQKGVLWSFQSSR
jgi:hypothetical protein